jgi:hypothetical protein
MLPSIKLFRIFWIALGAALFLVTLKYLFHALGWEVIEQSSLHNGVISSVTFVIGFLLSATIADYKESERIPSEFSSTIEDMYDDATAIHQNYPVFDLDGFRRQLRKVALGFGKEVRKGSHNASQDIRDLAPFFAAMEQGKVPPNFVVKLKQQSTTLLRNRQRVNYIQRIKFIPSATILARSIVLMTLALLLFTNIDPFYGGLSIVGIICFILTYILILINVISTPFHAAGRTQDDVSLYLVKNTAEYLSRNNEKYDV